VTPPGYAPVGAIAGSAVAVVLHVQPRATAGLDDARGRDEADDALPVSAPWLEQLEHAVVVRALSGERVTDVVCEMEVADAHGVGIAEGTDARLRDGPGADAAQAPQRGIQTPGTR